HLYDVDDKLIKIAGKLVNNSLFDWWEHELKIIAPPQKKKTEVQKQQEVANSAVLPERKAKPQKQEETAVQKGENIGCVVFTDIRWRIEIW
ncbi:MAG: hypothetical protein J5915_06305, partial [Acidaminococcaceae bacterium]|nr:hypothetical protein [Acidaminococcaceae bacterium]